MKQNGQQPIRNGERGVALLVVMGLLVILFGLAITFLIRANTERAAAAGFAAAVSSEQLADVAVNLVQGQIHHATTHGPTVAWTSQPGMIRNFNTAGQMTRAYKLYSAANLVFSGDAEGLAEEVAANDTAGGAAWAGQRALWTDLNAPVLVPNPNGEGEIGRYPILDPRAEGQVEGFSVNAPPAESGANANPLPMPVRWLYMLEDGTLIAPEPLDANRVTVAGATRSNPIVGRIAFWTDDETCKLNINTSGEGTYWDVPRANLVDDKRYARFQPARNEFQRYPGHPAMNSLAPVFFAEPGSNGVAAPNPLPAAQREALYEILPRIVGGGSNGGTAVPAGALIPGVERLYASVDEFILDPDRELQLAAAGIDPERLQFAPFFLTASSRAPEITLFNTPRVAMWPIDADGGPGTPFTQQEQFRSAYDRLLAFCATINNYPYYFTRSDPGSTTFDFPGPPTLEDFSGQAGRSFFLNRNRNLYAYLQGLTARQIPGFGGTLLGKYGADRDQILTLMFDYIRATNTDDSMLHGNFRYSLRALANSPEATSADPSTGHGFGQVVPIQVGNGAAGTRGLGRFPVLAEVGINIICSADGGDGSPGGLHGSNSHSNRTLEPDTVPGQRVLLEAGERRIEALFFMETFIPGQGWPTVAGNYSARVRGLENFSVNGIPMGFPASGISNWMMRQGNDMYDGGMWGGTVSARFGLASGRGGRRLPARGVMPADTNWGTLTNEIWPPTERPFYVYPFVSHPITVDASGGTMTFSGGTITVEIFAGRHAHNTTPPEDPVLTYEMTFPPTTLPVPELVGSGTPGSPTVYQYRPTAKEDWWTFSFDGCMPPSEPITNHPFYGTRTYQIGRAAGWSASPIWGGGNLGPGALFREGDVVRSLVPEHSDFRLAGLRPVNFVPHPLYESPARLAHSLVQGFNSNSFLGSSLDPNRLLVLGANQHTPANRPKVSIHSPNSRDFGDWDNGIGVVADGAYMNFPDGGNAIRLTTGAVPYFLYNLQGGFTNFAMNYSNNPDGNYTMNPVPTLFSPNRQVPSAGMFGSLPSRVRVGTGEPFHTLLFRPQPGHFGWAPPRDHLWADLFWMPVVEPYAISEPFSTAGKVNMNYQIQPFDYIRRATAMAGVLRSEHILLIGSGQGTTYKDPHNAMGASSETLRRAPVNIAETLRQFDETFAEGEVFRSATQICEIHLVPQGETLASASAPDFWSNRFALTGDNSRERPYTNLLGRLTTKSNTYTVHYRVQPLRKSPAGDPEIWDERVDQAVAESRGSTVIERYINPNDPEIPDYASMADGNPNELPDLGSFYKWRVVNTRLFAP